MSWINFAASSIAYNNIAVLRASRQLIEVLRQMLDIVGGLGVPDFLFYFCERYN